MNDYVTIKSTTSPPPTQLGLSILESIYWRISFPYIVYKFRADSRFVWTNLLQLLLLL